MKLINNTHKYIFYYIPNNQDYGVLPFGYQAESNNQILAFDNVNSWKDYINTDYGTDSWFDDVRLQAELDNVVIENNGYLTEYGFRLDTTDDTERYLDSLVSDTDMVTIKTFSGDEYTLGINEYKALINQYKQDRPLYLNVFNLLSDIK